MARTGFFPGVSRCLVKLFPIFLAKQRLLGETERRQTSHYVSRGEGFTQRAGVRICLWSSRGVVASPYLIQEFALGGLLRAG